MPLPWLGAAAVALVSSVFVAIYQCEFAAINQVVSWPDGMSRALGAAMVA
jgi:hypothetical protein